jgi:hypothetical protein
MIPYTEPNQDCPKYYEMMALLFKIHIMKEIQFHVRKSGGGR